MRGQKRRCGTGYAVEKTGEFQRRRSAVQRGRQLFSCRGVFGDEQVGCGGWVGGWVGLVVILHGGASVTLEGVDGGGRFCGFLCNRVWRGVGLLWWWWWWGGVIAFFVCK